MGFLATLKAGSKKRRELMAAFAAAILMFSLPSGAASPVEREYEAAVKSFRSGRTSEAFGQFIDLANRGDVDSARIALFMHSYGAVLYGKQWEAGPQEVAYWNTLVRNSGTSARPLPEFQPTVLTPRGAKPRPAPARMPAAPELANVARN
jgi:hypothetical protein